MRTKQRTHVYVLAGLVERPDGRGGYRWAEGYSRDGREYPWLTKSEARAAAKADSARAAFNERGRP